MTTLLQVRQGFEWLLSFFARADWPPRRSRLEPQLPAVARPPATPVGSEDFRSVSILDHRIGWYLDLAETLLDWPLSYKPSDGYQNRPASRSGFTTGRGFGGATFS